MTTVKEVIAKNDYPLVDNGHFMEVMEDEESREEKPRAPERIRNPSIEVEVIWGRRIVSNHRWAFPVVIIVDHRRLGVLRTCRRWSFGVPSRRMGHHR
jgi:hypothetical protein